LNRQFLSPKQVVDRYGENAPSLHTLESWRRRANKGKGPDFIRLGRKVAYPMDKLIEWENRGSP
jgi:hypothetical protein